MEKIDLTASFQASPLGYLSGVGYLGTGPGAISGGYDDLDYGYKAPQVGSAGSGRGRSPSPTPPPPPAAPSQQPQQGLQRPPVVATPSPVHMATPSPHDDGVRGGGSNTFWSRDSDRDSFSTGQDRDSYG